MFGRRKRDREAIREREALDAAAQYLIGIVADDLARAEEAVTRGNPLRTQAGVVEIARRAVSALAAERGTSVDDVLASLVADPGDT